ncbi:acyclic terpene utilization AtuA family protein [Dactylosporangium sp. NPDC005572]|uniref:acyclic terpene utilization AtuA family protein n=1 Tax=Dactylosporangium sp. NPDC005572 TaxID=3156889 RepID=UPI0033B2E8D3
MWPGVRQRPAEQATALAQLRRLADPAAGQDERIGALVPLLTGDLGRGGRVVEPTVECLEADAQIVVGGRLADPSLFVGPICHAATRRRSGCASRCAASRSTACGPPPTRSSTSTSARPAAGS